METEKPALLIVDDDDAIRLQMKWALAAEYQVLPAEDRASALEVARRERPPVVTLDLGLPPHAEDVREGFATLSELLELNPATKIIVITGQTDRQHALKAVDQGAYDFFAKPIDAEILKVVLKRAYNLYQIEQENRRLKDGPQAEESFEGMLGCSRSMQEVFASIKKVAGTEAPVLIYGESGTGKELAARAIHRRSRRSQGAFVAINCGAIPENLLESELFGHEKGSFTGAHMQRPGQFELAQKGTLFLDEIGELPLALQVKLLRFLQEGTIVRVGGRKEISIDARILAATNIELEKAVREQKFREDLYYRLAVVVITIPPVRDRDGDQLLLAQHFLRAHSEESRKKVGGFTADAKRAIESHQWPGNVRELENRIRRAVIMEEGGRITLESLGFGSAYSRLAGRSLKDAREAVEREVIHRALMRHHGNMSRAAEELEISRPALYDLVEKLGIQRPES